MESYNPTNIEVLMNNPVPFQSLTENRVQALKSLTLLLLNELNILESLHFQKDKFLDDSQISLAEAVEKFEIELIRSALVRAKGSQTVAARLLKTKTTTLNVKIKRLGIEPKGVTLVQKDKLPQENFASVKTIG